MIFFKSKCFCVLCKHYKTRDKMNITHKAIGVCNSCRLNLLTSKDKSFDGKDNVKIVLSPYIYSGAIRDAVKDYKFSGQRMYGELFGKMLCAELSDYAWLGDYDLIIPVPLHEKRVMDRGYNQSEILAGVLSEHFKIPLLTDVLFRVRETVRQSSLKGTARTENVRGAFWAHPESVKGKRIILIDDIYTMGETVKACAAALRDAGADEVAAVTLCITLTENNRPPKC